MDTMDKERKEGKETHDWRVEGASAAEEWKEEGYKKEYKEYTVLFPVLNIIVEDFVEEEQI